MRHSAAASPPRICGPLDRTMSPYQPAFAAASSSMFPAVITPAPPLPVTATETLVRVAALVVSVVLVTADLLTWAARGPVRCVSSFPSW